MKATALYEDTTNQVARAKDGTWFYREYRFNGYSTTWTRWQVTDEPKPVTVLENKYSGEMMPVEPGRAIWWGFKSLSRSEQGHHFVRLPNHF